jgi:hypothetical protein
MIAGSDYMEISHENDVVYVTIRQRGITAVARLPIGKAYEAKRHLEEHLVAANTWRPPGLIEYTGETDSHE